MTAPALNVGRLAPTHSFRQEAAELEFHHLLAGFAVAHAAWSVSDLPAGELLVPLAVIEKDGQRRRMGEGNGAPDHVRPGVQPVLLGRLPGTGDALAVVDGTTLARAAAARLVENLDEGVRPHPKAGQLWPGWRIKR